MAYFATDWVAHNARWFAGSPALEQVETGRVLTWDQLEARVTRLAGAMAHRLGLRKGDRVAVLAENDIRVFELQFACMRLGAVLVPLNWRLAPVELKTLCEDFLPTLLVHDATWRDAAHQLSTSAGIEHVLSWGVADAENDLEQLVDANHRYEARREHVLTDATHVLYTSGTTGLPKGAVSTFGSLAAGAANLESLTSMTGPGTKQFNPLPLFHAAGLNALTNPILYGGGCIAIARRFDPDQVLQLIGSRESDYSHYTAVPTMYELMARSSHLESADFSRIRQCHVGGTLDQERVELFADRGLLIQQGYGGTEVGTYATIMPRDAVRTHHGSCGVAVRNIQIRLVSPDNGREVAAGEVGEAWLNGPSITRGYWNRSSVDSEAFQDGWYRTGDALRCDDQGFYHVVDRYKDMFKSGGESVFPAEVERVLLRFPGIVEAAVVPNPDERWGTVGRAIVVTAGTTSFDVEALTSYCKERLAKYKIPRYFDLLDSLPRNATGKVIKAELVKQFADPPRKGD